MKVAHFYCYGRIGPQDDRISAKKVSEFLAALSPSITDVNFHINSEGGYVDEGFSIYDLLMASDKKITTINEGSCYSIATVPFMAGSTRIITPNSRLMIHMPRVVIDGENEVVLTADDAEELSLDLRESEQRVLNFYMQSTGTDRGHLEELLRKDSYLNADKSLELKFATEISMPLRAVAEYKIKNKNENKMNILNKNFKEKLAAAKTAINDLFKAEAIAVVASSATTADGNTTVYYDGMFEVGTNLFSDDAMTSPLADGSYDMQDGNTVIVTNGAVSEIKPTVAASASTEPTMEELKSKVAQLEAEKKNISDAHAELEKESLKAVAELTGRLKAIKSEYVPKTSSTQFKQTRQEVKLSKEEREQALRDADAASKKK